MYIYPPDTKRWHLRLPRVRDFADMNPLGTSMPDEDDPMRAVTPLGVEPEEYVEEDLKEPYYNAAETRMTTGLIPSQNVPGTIGRVFPVITAKGVVTVNVGDSDTTVTFSLPDRGGSETAVLLMPYDTTGSAYYEPSECLPQYVIDDEILVFRVEDGTWYAPGPFIPIEKIKEIFECP